MSVNNEATFGAESSEETETTRVSDEFDIKESISVLNKISFRFLQHCFVLERALTQIPLLVVHVHILPLKSELKRAKQSPKSALFHLKSFLPNEDIEILIRTTTKLKIEEDISQDGSKENAIIQLR